MTDQLRSLEAGRLDPPIIDGADIRDGYTWHRGFSGATFRRVRIARQRIEPRLLGRRPRFARWTIEDCHFESIIAKRSDFIDVRADGLSLAAPSTA